MSPPTQGRRGKDEKREVRILGEEKGGAGEGGEGRERRPYIGRGKEERDSRHKEEK